MSIYRKSQKGIMLLEVLVAIVIFAIGILAMIHLQAASIAAQSDAQYRIEAGHFIDDLITQIRVNVAHDATTGAIDTDDLATFQRNMTTTDTCQFTGGSPANAKSLVTDWIRAVRGVDASDVAIVGKGLPNAVAQIVTNSPTSGSGAGMSEVRVTICWQAATDKAPRSHVVVAYVD